jgi:TerC family integral membrane protein
MSLEPVLLWGGFMVIIVAVMAFDLFFLNRKAHVVAVKEALLWSALWIAVSLIFGAGVFVFLGDQKGMEYLTGYVIEKSLSVDNIFVFLVIFQYFAVPPYLQPKVLRWGIIGALVMRLIFILAGAALLSAFHWMIFVFGGILLYTAFRLATQKEHEVHPERNPVIRIFRRFMPVAPDYQGDRFFTRLDGPLLATPLLVVLLMIETTDVVFAIDSIPAIFAVTRDPFIVFTSNAFAILGLRALYFALAGIVGYFTYLRQGLVVILAFVGVKMIASEMYKIPTPVSLAVIAAILAVAIGLSLVARRRAAAPEAPTTDGSGFGPPGMPAAEPVPATRDRNITPKDES